VKSQKFLATTSVASLSGHHWKRGKSGSRRFQAPQHDLEALDLVAKSLDVTSTFMRLSPEGGMHPGRDHEAEKSGKYCFQGVEEEEGVGRTFRRAHSLSRPTDT